MLISLAVTAALSWSAYVVNDHTEGRLLRLKVAETGAVLQAAIPQMQTTLASAAEFAATSSDPAAGFKRYIAGYVGEGSSSARPRSGSSIAAGPRLVTVVGLQPKLAADPAGAGAVLSQPARAAGVRVIGLFDKPNRRLGYAYSAGAARRTYVVYAESVLPADGLVPVTRERRSRICVSRCTWARADRHPR